MKEYILALRSLLRLRCWNDHRVFIQHKRLCGAKYMKRDKKESRKRAENDTGLKCALNSYEMFCTTRTFRESSCLASFIVSNISIEGIREPNDRFGSWSIREVSCSILIWFLYVTESMTLMCVACMRANGSRVLANPHGNELDCLGNLRPCRVESPE